MREMKEIIRVTVGKIPENTISKINIFDIEDIIQNVYLKILETPIDINTVSACDIDDEIINEINKIFSNIASSTACPNTTNPKIPDDEYTQDDDGNFCHPTYDIINHIENSDAIEDLLKSILTVDEYAIAEAIYLDGISVSELMDDSGAFPVRLHTEPSKIKYEYIQNKLSDISKQFKEHDVYCKMLDIYGEEIRKYSSPNYISL